MSTSALTDSYAAYLMLERSLSANTREAYVRDVARFLEYVADESLSLSDLTLDHFHHFMVLLSELGIGERSICRAVSSLRSFFHFLVLDGRLDADPTELLRTPSFGRHLPRVLSVEEVDALIAAIDLSKPEGRRDRAMIEMLYSCGLRVSELCELRLSCVFKAEGYVRVVGKGSKERLVPLSDRAAHELDLWAAERNQINPKPGEEDYVFISAARRRHLSRITVFHNLRQYAAAAGIQGDISPHTLRHTFATHLLEGGANLRVIQQLLGHETIATTDIYMHLANPFLREQVLKYFPRNRSAHPADPS